MLRPQDLLLLLRFSLLPGGERRTYQQLSLDLGMSVSEVHAGVTRSRHSQLVVPRDGAHTVNRTGLFEFVVHGLRYWLPPERGQMTRGIPTAHAAPPLASRISSAEPPPVWPHAEGQTRGEAFAPIYRSAPTAALANHDLYEVLALVDALRGGQARERKMAAELLHDRWFA